VRKTVSADSAQWGIQEFEQRKPLFRARSIDLALLALAALPFGIAAVYWLECQFLFSSLRHPQLMMWSSVALGAVLAASVSIIVTEWAKRLHYNKLQERDDALSHCVELLHRALDDNEIVKELVRDEKDRTGLVRRIRSTVVSSEKGLRVEAYDDELVFLVIDRWIQKTQTNRQVGVIDTKLRPMSQAENLR